MGRRGTCKCFQNVESGEIDNPIIPYPGFEMHS